ncbi:hypothetical protein [Sphingomonas sp. LHG3443-2]|uniref:hypothetical protein n=1 Tax=Sphingomonas sp. LHG3443-2 TaxID=2804639 RepID=UPI003CE911B3
MAAPGGNEIIVPDPEEGLWDFRFELPADFTWREELVPIDTRGKVWRAPAIPEFGISLDSYASEPVRCPAAPCRSWQEPLAGGVATITRDAWLNQAEGVAGTLNIHLPLIRRRDRVTLALVVMARCSTRAACDRALEVARTIRVVRRSRS